MTTYYLRDTGSDSNSGVDSGHAKRTWLAATALLGSGDSLDVRGVFDEGIEYNWIPSGIDNNHRTTIVASDTTVVRGVNAFGFVGTMYDRQFVTFDGLTFDGQLLRPLGFLIGTNGSGNAGCHYVDFINFIAKNFRAGTSGAMSQNGGPGYNTHIRYANFEIHNCEGAKPQGTHGLYLTAKDSIVENGYIHDVDGHCFHQYSGTGSGINNNIVRNLTLYRGGQWGALLGGGSNNLAYNILASACGMAGGGGGMRIGYNYSGTNNRYYNVTSTGNTGYGILVHDSTSSQVKNAISYGNSIDGVTIDVSTAPGTTTATNLSTSPTFVGVGDYHIDTGSAAIGAGTDFSLIFTTDIEGSVRDTWDIGAYAYSGSSSPRTHITGTFTVSNKIYDGSTSATVLTRGLVGVLGGDTVTLSGGVANFDDPEVDAAKPVHLTGAFLTGADAYKYTLDSVADTSADITVNTHQTASISCAFTIAPLPFVGRVNNGKPYVWLYRMYLDGDSAGDGTRNFATKETNHPDRVYEGRVLSGGRVERSIPVPSGLMQVSDATVTLADTDSAVRNFLAPKTSMRRLCELKLCQEGTSEADAPVAFIGEIVGARFSAGKATIQMKDIHSRWLDQTIPPFITRSVGLVDSSGAIDPLLDSSGEPLFPNLPVGVDSVFAPLVLGQCISPDDNPSGVLKLQLVDTVLNRYVVARHPCEDIPAVYRKLAEDESFSIVDPSEYTIVEIPTDFEGIHYAITVVEFDVAQPENADIRADVLGVSARGEFGGLPAIGFTRNIVDHLINLTFYATLKQPVEPRYDLPTWRETRERCFDANYVADYIIDTPMTWRAALSQLCSSNGIDYYQNKYAQLALSLTIKSDPDRPEFTDLSHILRNSVDQGLADPTFNKIRYFYARNHATKEWAFSRSRDNEEDQEALGEIQETPFEMWAVRDSVIAASGLILPEEIARQRLKWLGLDSWQFECDLMAPAVIDDLELSKLVGFTHYAGISGPYENAEFKVYSISLDLDRLKYHIKAVKPTDLPISPPLVIPVCPIADLQVGVAWEYTLVASGGAPPYTYTITGGALPTGLNLDPDTGVISGTPTVAATFEYEFTVTDSEFRAGSHTCELTVEAETDSAGDVVGWVGTVALEMHTLLIQAGYGTEERWDSTALRIDPAKYDAVDEVEVEILVYNAGFESHDVKIVDEDGAVRGTITVPAGSGTVSGFLYNPLRMRGTVTLAGSAKTYYMLIEDFTPEGEFDESIWLFASRVLIHQVGATKTRLQFPLLDHNEGLQDGSDISGAAQTNSTSYTQDSQEKNFHRYYKDAAMNATVVGCSLEATVLVTGGAGTAFAALYKTGTTAPIGAASGAAASWTVISADFDDADMDDLSEFDPQMKITGGGVANYGMVNLYIELDGITNAQVFRKSGRCIQSANASDVDLRERMLFDSDEFGTSASLDWEVTAKLDSGADTHSVSLLDLGTSDTSTSGSDVETVFPTTSKTRMRETGVTLVDGHRYGVSYELLDTPPKFMSLGPSFIILNTTD